MNLTATSHSNAIIFYMQNICSVRMSIHCLYTSLAVPKVVNRIIQKLSFLLWYSYYCYWEGEWSEWQKICCRTYWEMEDSRNHKSF